jgi:protein-S-isoprenylcysteine O-methyltransferase Ste14
MKGLLLVTLAIQLLLFVSLGVSIVAPKRRIWPPPSRHSWQFYFTWVGSWITLSGAFLLAVLDQNTSGSRLTGTACLSIALWHLVVPFAEEPWLAQQFGSEYEEYRRTVPRFLGLPRQPKKAVTPLAH